MTMLLLMAYSLVGEEPLFFFLLGYIAIMGLFVFVGRYLSEGLKRIGRKTKRK